MGRDDLTKAGSGTVEVELRGKKLLVSPLTMGDLVSFQSYLKSEKLKQIRVALGSVQESPMDKEERLDLQFKAVSTPIDGEVMQQEMMGLPGFCYILWCSLKKKQNMTLEEVQEMATIDDIHVLLPIIEALSGMGDDEEDDEGNPKTEKQTP